MLPLRNIDQTADQQRKRDAKRKGYAAMKWRHIRAMEVLILRILISKQRATGSLDAIPFVPKPHERLSKTERFA